MRVRQARLVERLCSSPIRFALVMAFLYVSFLQVWGTADKESLFKFESAYGARYADLRLGAMAVRHGVATVWGVPVFDATQGFGYRLPLQGSLGQTPFVFLRYIMSAEAIQLSYLFPALTCCLWTVAAFCSTPGLVRARWGRPFVVVSLLGPIVLFTIVNEWTPTAASFCSRATLILLLLRIAANSQLPLSHREAGRWAFAGGIALVYLISGHPGEWPLSAPTAIVAIALLLNRGRRLDSYRVRWSLGAAGIVTVLGVMSTLVVSISELIVEAERPTTGAFRAPQSYLVHSAVKIPNVVSALGNERLAEIVVLLVMAAVGPIVNFYLKTSGRYEFVCLIGLLPVVMGYLQVQRGPRHRIVGAGLSLIAVTLTWWLGELTFFPAVTQSSGAFQHAPQVLFTNVLLLAIVGTQKKSTVGTHSRLRSTQHVLALVALLTVALQPLSLLNRTRPKARTLESKELESRRFFPENVRSSALIRNVRTAPGGLAPGWVRSFSGRPALESEPKIRNASTLSLRDKFSQVVLTQDLLSAGMEDVRDFMSLAMVVAATEDEDAGALVADTDGERLQAVVLPDGTPGVLLERRQFHAFVLDRTELEDGDRRCPLLDAPSCLSVIAPRPVEARSAPRWRIGSNGEVATYDWDAPVGTWGVLVPMDYDSALAVVDRATDTVLTTHSHYGLLAIEVPPGQRSGTVEIGVRPDIRMYGRALSTYLVTFGIATGALMTLRVGRRHRL